MKTWKEELLTAYEKAAETDKQISLYEIAKENGYDHISRQDITDIVNAFCRKHPEYRPVIMLDYDGQNASLFTHGVLTMLEYEN